MEYAKANGHALISAPEVFKGYPLGTWVDNQRRHGQVGKLTEERRERLDSIPGWVWSLEEERWENGFRHLLEYIGVRRHSRVGQTYETEDKFRLGAWVNFQRTRYNQGKLEPSRIDRLAPLPGWVWRASEAKWEEGFQRLLEFAEAHGNVRVPVGYEVDGVKLRIWSTNQRAKFDELSPDHHRRRSSITTPFPKIGYRSTC